MYISGIVITRIFLVLVVVSVAYCEEFVQAVYDSSNDILHFNGGAYRREVSLGDDQSFAVNLFFTFLCVLAAALASGLTMGLVSIEPFDMQIIMQANEADCPTESEREELRREKLLAKKVYPLISRHHQLLVSLLLLNSVANEALPLFLNQIVSPVFAVGVSVTAVLIFGEILPSAIFTGPNQLAIGAAMAPFVWLLMSIFWVIAYPCSILLDRMLGEEHKGRYNKAEFRARLNFHNDQVDEELGQETGESFVNKAESTRQFLSRSGIAKRELTIMQGALELYRLKCKDVMVPLDEVYMLSKHQLLDQDTLDQVMARGHSRIPVFEYHPHNVRGMLLVKRLIVLNPQDKHEVGSMALLEPLVAHTDCTLLDLLYEFSAGKSHLALVTSEPERVMEAFRTDKQIPVNVHMAGIITLEDVIERLIKHEINDESDITLRLARSEKIPAVPAISDTLDQPLLTNNPN